jgi:hypothetical protein
MGEGLERVVVIDLRKLYKIGGYDPFSNPLEEVLRHFKLKPVAYVGYAPAKESKDVVVEEEYKELKFTLIGEMPSFYQIHDIVTKKINWQPVIEKADKIAKRFDLYAIIYLPTPSTAQVVFVRAKKK